MPRPDYPLRAVPFTRSVLTDTFWAPRIERNRRVSLPHALAQCDQTGRFDNFTFAGRRNAGEAGAGAHRGLFFNDSDAYKLLEGASEMLETRRDPVLEKTVDGLIARIAAAQEKDGYLYTPRTLCGADYMPPGGRERWSDLGGGHELYCAGHLYEAAAAHFRATGKRTLLDIAIRNADLVCRVFGPGRKTTPDGHPEVEIGLVKLWRATGKRAYLDLARFFLDRRGDPARTDRIGPYAQDHQPLAQQTQAVGHAVRAVYLYSGAADVAELADDPVYGRAVDRLWDDVVASKLYVTGGIGARGGGEAFGDDYELPNRTAYAETCAAIGLALWSQRMFLRHGDARYVDVLERVLYNGLLSGVALSGTGFFYTNPLESRQGATRPPWHECACCPPNVLRLLPTVGGFVYAQRERDLFVNLFVAGHATIDLPTGRVRVSQEGRYPWDGSLRIAVDPERAARFALRVRIPGWAREAPVPSSLYRFADRPAPAPTVAVNGKPVALVVESGYVRIERTWKPGDMVTLELPMPTRRVVAHPKVAADRGRVSLQRGPIVYCAEGVDQNGKGVLARFLPDDVPVRVRPRPDLLGGTVLLESTARDVVRADDGAVGPGAEAPVVFVPYALWANRERGEMAVWVAREAGAAQLPPLPTYARTAKWSASGGVGLESVVDQQEPARSIDHANPFFHWWPRKGTDEWVQADLATPTRLAGVSVYWFDDTGIGECRLPKAWRVRAKVDGVWQEVAAKGAYGVAGDRYNRTDFAPVTAEAIRLEIRLPDGFSAGIHEVRLYDARGRELP